MRKRFLITGEKDLQVKKSQHEAPSLSSAREMQKNHREVLTTHIPQMSYRTQEGNKAIVPVLQTTYKKIHLSGKRITANLKAGEVRPRDGNPAIKCTPRRVQVIKDKK